MSDTLIIKSISSHDVSLKDWIQVQEKTFLRWINSKLQTHNHAPLLSLTDLGSGVELYHLLNSLDPDFNLRPIYQRPNLKFQKMENLNRILDYLKHRQNLQIHNIGAEDIVDGNSKLTLGLIWLLLLNYTVFNSSDETDTFSKKELLLRWCKKVTDSYADIKMTNFTSSWSSGHAFCALLNYFKPDLLDYQKAAKMTNLDRLELAMAVAESVGISRLLDPENVDCAKPDEKSVVAYVSLFYDRFNKEPVRDTVGTKTRLETFLGVVTEITGLKTEYLESLVRLIERMRETLDAMQRLDADVAAKQAFLKSFRAGKKLQFLEQYSRLESMRSKINLMLVEFHFSRLSEPQGRALQDALELLKKIVAQEQTLSGDVAAQLARLKEDSFRKLRHLSHNVSAGLDLVENDVVQLSDVAEAQINELPEIMGDLQTMEKLYERLRGAKEEFCRKMQVMDQSFDFKETEQLYRVEELGFRIKLVRHIIVDKLTFIETQLDKKERIIKRMKTSSELSSVQLCQLEMIFDKFDQGDKMYLNKSEFREAMTFIYPSLSTSEADNLFEYLYASSSDITRGVKLKQFLEIPGLFGEKPNRESELVDLTSRFYYEAFEEASGGRGLVGKADLERLQLDSQLVAGIEEVFEREDDSFNYSRFFDGDDTLLAGRPVQLDRVLEGLSSVNMDEGSVANDS
ncbi:hypothetical protein KL909_004919 [Ogataea angusta]|nr:hypothetical protein KL909_004919 [Ogataea angusta]